MWAHTMCVQDYESLINRGWRRSGQFCYKPSMKTTCCPQYTIRCDVTGFQMNNSHKKVLKKFRNYLAKDVSPKKLKKLFPNESEEPSPSCESNVASKLEEADCSAKNSKSNTPCKTLEDFLEGHDKNLGCLVIRTVDPSSTEFEISSLTTSFKLYQKYQIQVHNDKEEECTMEQFKRFLVKSPLQKLRAKPGLDIEYGTFHQQYWIDGNLVAVGVVDILPTCLSSVYFFYDPDYSFLSLGTYGSLREIAFTRKVAQRDPSFHWYYLGFYIHSCPKMYYKGQYKPSYLLCPEHYNFEPFSDCVPKLNVSKYSLLSSAPLLPNETDPLEVSILYQRKAIPFSLYCLLKTLDEDEVNEIKEYFSLVGKDCASRMLLYRS
nr:EOG090X06AF [Simocephalus serrulatus]